MMATLYKVYKVYIMVVERRLREKIEEKKLFTQSNRI